MSRARRFWFVLAAALAVGAPGSVARGADTQAERDLRAEMDKARRELAEAEIQVETAKRRLPPAFDRAQEEKELRRAAQRAELAAIEIEPAGKAEPVASAGTGPSGLEIHRLDVSGTDAYEKIHMFLTGLVLFPRTIDLETLDLRAGPEDTVTLKARLALPVLSPVPRNPPALPAPPAPLSGLGSPTDRAALQRAYEEARANALRAQLAEINGRLLAQRGLLRALRDRDERRRVLFGHALALLTRDMEAQAVALTEVRFDDAVTFKGVTLGGSAPKALKAGFAKAGFPVAEITASPLGRCQSFVARTGFQVQDPPFEAVLGNGLFDAPAPSVCAPERPVSLGQVKARGKTPGDAALTLRLRATEASHVVRVLSELTTQSFVVDADVAGTLGVDVDGVLPDEIFAALGSAGLKVGPGPLRRVSRAGATDAPVHTYTGAPISLSLTRADLVDVLRFFHERTSLPILVPEGLKATATIFGTDVMWDQALDALIASAGLTYVIEGNRIFAGPAAAVAAAGHPGFVDVTRASQATAGDRREWWKSFDFLEKLGPEDLELAGLGRASAGWTAYAFGPSGRLWTLSPGQSLAGASVKSVSSAGVTFDAGGRALEVPFRP